MDVGVSEVVVRSGLEVTVQEQQRRVNHEKGEGEMERFDTCATNLFRHFGHACMCTRMKMCEVRSERAVRRKMCVRQVSVLPQEIACGSCGPIIRFLDQTSHQLDELDQDILEQMASRRITTIAV